LGFVENQLAFQGCGIFGGITLNLPVPSLL